MGEKQEVCYLRLPCGICRMTMTDCPKEDYVYSTLTPTVWLSTNCEVNAAEKEVKDDGSV